MKKFIALSMSVLMLLGSMPAFAAENTRMVYNNNEVSIDGDVIIKDGYTFLPAASTFKAAGMRVIEKSSNDSLTAEARNQPGYVSVWVNSKKGRMNGQNIQLGIAPFRENGVTYVSSKFIEEQCGVKVSYDSSKNTIYINSSGEGKITSTVGQVTTQTTSKTSTTSNSSSSSTKASTGTSVYSGFKYLPNFASVANVKAPIDGDTAILGLGNNNVYTRIFANGNIVGYKYEYYDATENDYNNYITALKNAGFTLKAVTVLNVSGYSFSKGSEKGTINSHKTLLGGPCVQIEATW